jgi:SAM-dependent methyltransferase
MGGRASAAASGTTLPPGVPAAVRHALMDELRRVLASEMFERTTANHQPNANPFNEHFRDLPALHWNLKALGADLAARHYGQVAASRVPLRDDPFVCAWRPTRFEDYLQRWFLETCARLRLAPVLHRKLWEETYVVNCLHARGKLAPGCRGIVFGVGQERLPAYIASMGAEILATDMPLDSRGARDWIETEQHGSLERLFYPDYLTREEFSRLVSFRYADMNHVPDDLDGSFDFCWSICAFEHLGSIDKGLAFVERSGRLLRPGGVAVHTTEFNYTSDEQTIDNWGTVLFRRRDLQALYQRLEASGFEVPAIEFGVGSEPVDFFVDVPPYPQHREAYYHPEMSALHLKLMVDGFPATCFGLCFGRPA